MAWEHFTASKEGPGILTVTDLATKKNYCAKYAIGKVETGRSRSFHGYRLIVYFKSEEFIGDSHSMQGALMACAQKLEAAGLEINVAGLSSDFHESGLSSNSGFGYDEKRGGGSIHMMSEQTNYGAFYVYALVDPYNGNKPFYIGKGIVNRGADHLNEASKMIGLNPELVLGENEKVEEKVLRKHANLIELKNKGATNKDIVRVICRQLPEDIAFTIESCLIRSIYGLENLTNEVTGHHEERFREFDNFNWIDGFDLKKNNENELCADDGKHQCGAFYVYALIDPEDKSIFYIGKGHGNRARQHFTDAMRNFYDSDKIEKLQELLYKGYSEADIIRIVARVDSGPAAFMIESFYINFVVGADNICNLQGGHESGLFRSKGDWELRRGFDIPIVVEKGQRRVELLDQFLGQGLDLKLQAVQDAIKIKDSSFELEFSEPGVMGAGELVISALIDDVVFLRTQIRSPATGTFNTIIEPRGTKQKEWITSHFQKLGKESHLWGNLRWFNCKSWSHQNLAKDVDEAARRAILLVKLIRVKDISELSMKEQQELFPD
jgi:hypothetical protein